MPMMCHAVVAVAAMSVVGGVSALVTVEDAAKAAAEVVDNWQCRRQLRSVINFSQFFF